MDDEGSKKVRCLLHKGLPVTSSMYNEQQGHNQRRRKWFEWQNVMIFATSWASQDSLKEKRKNS